MTDEEKAGEVVETWAKFRQTWELHALEEAIAAALREARAEALEAAAALALERARVHCDAWKREEVEGIKTGALLSRGSMYGAKELQLALRARAEEVRRADR